MVLPKTNKVKWEPLSKLELHAKRDIWHMTILRESDNKAYFYFVSDRYYIIAEGKCKTLNEAKKKTNSIVSYILEHGEKSYLAKYGGKKKVMF